MSNITLNTYDPITVTAIQVGTTSADYYVYINSEDAVPSGITASNVKYYVACAASGGYLAVDGVGTVNERCGAMLFADASGTIESVTPSIVSGKLRLRLEWHIIGTNRPDPGIYGDTRPFGTSRSQFMFVAN